MSRFVQFSNDDPSLDLRAECLGRVALDFKNLVAEVLPVAISPAAMMEEKGWFSGDGIFEPGEQFSTIDCLGALFALLYFKHHFLTSRGTQAMP
jgi:hypothetical protein